MHFPKCFLIKISILIIFLQVKARNLKYIGLPFRQFTKLLYRRRIIARRTRERLLFLESKRFVEGFNWLHISDERSRIIRNVMRVPSQLLPRCNCISTTCYFKYTCYRRRYFTEPRHFRHASATALSLAVLAYTRRGYQDE